MSPCKPLNDQALMPLPIITIGVLITTTILLFSVISIFDNHPMKIETELETIGSILNQKIQSVDTFCIEQKIQWNIPDSMNKASIFLTPNSIIIKEQSGNKEYMHTKNGISSWWVHLPHSTWTNASTFHQYLSRSFGHDGTIHDPLPDDENIQMDIKNQFETTQKTILIEPIQFDVSKPIIIEKLIIYYEENVGFFPEPLQSFILIYQ